MMTVHLNRGDVPETLALLDALLGQRDPLPAGYGPDDTGADVNWDLLEGGSLSTSQKAVVHIAQGLALLEGDGGRLPLDLRESVLAAVQTIVEVP